MSPGRFIGSSIFWIVLALALFTHVAYLASDHEYYGADTPSYLIPADNLLHGQGFVNGLHQPELHRTPGYPFLLAIFRITPLRVEYLVFVQHALCILLVVLVAAIALRITGSRLVALVAAAVLSLDIATILIANLLLTEITSTVLIAFTAWAVYRAMTNPSGNVMMSVAAGFFGGSATLVRPVCALYFVPLSICLYLAFRQKAWRFILVFVIIFSLFPVLWATRNYVEGNYFGLSTIGAEDILYYRASGALAIQQPGSYLANAIRIRQQMIDQACGEMENLYKRKCLDVTEPQQAAYASRKGKKIIADNLFGYFRSALVSLAYIVFGGGAEAMTRLSYISPRMAEYLVLLFTVPEACLAIVGCWYWYRRDRNLCYLLVLSVVYFLMISAGAEAYSRFKVPIMPMYALLIGGGAASVVRIFRRVRTSHSASMQPVTTES